MDDNKGGRGARFGTAGPRYPNINVTERRLTKGEFARFVRQIGRAAISALEEGVKSVAAGTGSDLLDGVQKPQAQTGSCSDGNALRVINLKPKNPRLEL